MTNAALEHEMPLDKYMHEDPFENHPLFKTEEQAHIEDTMDGVPDDLVEHETTLDWPSVEDTFGAPPAVVEPSEVTRSRRRARRVEPKDPSDETLWSRPRDFDWGD